MGDGRASTFAAVLAATVFIGQIAGKWSEGGWVRLITFTTLFLAAHLLLISPLGYRNPPQIHRIVRDKSARPRCDGLHRRMAILDDAGVSLLAAAEDSHCGFPRLPDIRSVSSLALFSATSADCDYDHALHVDHPKPLHSSTSTSISRTSSPRDRQDRNATGSRQSETKPEYEVKSLSS